MEVRQKGSVLKGVMKNSGCYLHTTTASGAPKKARLPGHDDDTPVTYAAPSASADFSRASAPPLCRCPASVTVSQEAKWVRCMG